MNTFFTLYIFINSNFYNFFSVSLNGFIIMRYQLVQIFSFDFIFAVLESPRF